MLTEPTFNNMGNMWDGKARAAPSYPAYCLKWAL
jgi:hypothetical protein